MKITNNSNMIVKRPQSKTSVGQLKKRSNMNTIGQLKKRSNVTTLIGSGVLGRKLTKKRLSF